MPNNQNCHQILQVAKIYRRIFSVLIVNVGLENIIEENNSAEVKKCPTILALVFATGLATTTVLLQSIFSNGLPLSEFLALCFIVLSHYCTFAFPLINSMFNYRKIHLFWSKVCEITRFAYEELGYEICFEYFWKRFLTDGAITCGTFALYALIRFSIYSPRIVYGTQCGVIVLQEIVAYIVLHALFVVNLNSFFIRLLIKYIKMDYRNRASNLIFDHVQRSLLHQLRLYKQFHYKLWEMTTAVNAFFGLTLLVLSYHAFLDIAYSAYYVFLYVSRREPVVILMSNGFFLHWITPALISLIFHLQDLQAQFSLR